MKLEPHRIGGERSARQSRPLDRAFALLDPLLARPALVVESNDALGRAARVRHDEADGLARLRALGHERRYAIMCADAVWLAMPSMHHCGLLARGRRDRVPYFRRGLHRASAGGHFANLCENVRLRGSSPGRP